MNSTGIFNFLGNASEWFFLNVMETLTSLPNIFFISAGSIAFLIWMAQMSRYNKEAQENGTLK